ncbi:MAG: glycosyltransferase, partial [Candidatus Muiribacteriota bacterium]
NIINNSGGLLEHEICCIKKNGSAYDRLKKEVKVYELNKKQGNSLFFYYKLFKIIKKASPDIIHTRNLAGIDGIIAAKLAGEKKIIHSEHGWPSDDPLGKNFKRILIRWIVSFFVKNYIAVSADLAKWLNQKCYITKEKISVIINGVDTNKFNKSLVCDRKKFSFIEKDTLVLGSVGRLDKIKNFDLLIFAFYMLAKNNSHIKLVIAGNGAERNYLKKIVKKLSLDNKVFFTGEVKEIQNIYKLMDIFILPSKNEGISNTILEAMSSGLPVITTRVGGNEELIEDGKQGFLIKPDSMYDICKAVQKYIDNTDLISNHGKNARKKAVKDFALDKMVLKYTSLYQEIMDL